MLVHPMAYYMKYLIQDCYEEDYNPYDYETILDEYTYRYTFAEWYFHYRKLWKLNVTKVNKYKLTPDHLIVGIDILDSGFTYI
jgi:hypothetical protein